MMKAVIKHLYKRSKYVKNGVDRFHPKIRDFNLISRDLLAGRWYKIRLIGKVKPYTMVGHPRLSKLFELSSELNRKNIKGDFVECGVWNGGSAAIIAVNARDTKRRVWLFDSFEGLPEPTERDGQLAASYINGRPDGKLRAIGQCVGSELKVREILFHELGLDPQNVNIVKGWFQDTVPTWKDRVSAIALLHLDGDWYESTKVCLENLYPQVVSGGIIVLDDYGCWEGCRMAVDDYFKKYNITAELIRIDDTGVYFKKP